MGSFLLLDATDQAITLCWEREAGVTLEEVQMKRVGDGDSDGNSNSNNKGNKEEGGGGEGNNSSSTSSANEWTTLSKTLASSALRKKKLQAETAYVFRRRSMQGRSPVGQTNQGAASDETEEWGPWSATSEAFRTRPDGGLQPPAPIVKLREAGALVMEWPAITDANGYEVQMSASGAKWVTIAPRFGSTLLRKKGLEDSKQYRFRLRPVFDASRDPKEGRDVSGWSPSSALASPAVLNAFLRTQVPEQLVGKGKEVVSRTTLAGKIVAFYFSASWCGPCRKYTPQLAALYAKAKAQHKAFEVVFVSLDGDEESMAKYHAGMPWPAVPFDHPFREDFASSKGVSSIPRLIVTGSRGQEIASNAVGMTWEQLVAWEAQG